MNFIFKKLNQLLLPIINFLTLGTFRYALKIILERKLNNLTIKQKMEFEKWYKNSDIKKM